MVAAFLDDGTTTVDYGASNPVVGTTEVADVGAVSTTVTITGAMSRTWAPTPDGALEVHGDAGQVRVSVTSRVAGQDVPVLDTTLAAILADLPPSPVFTVAACDGDSLVLTNVYPGGSQTTTYQRER